MKVDKASTVIRTYVLLRITRKQEWVEAAVVRDRWPTADARLDRSVRSVWDNGKLDGETPYTVRHAPPPRFPPDLWLLFQDSIKQHFKN